MGEKRIFGEFIKKNASAVDKIDKNLLKKA